MDRISKSLMAKGVLSLALLALAQYLTRSVVWAAAGWSLASAVVFVFYDIRNGIIILRSRFAANDGLLPRFDVQRLVRLFRLALPLGITMLMISLNANIPRYFVAHDSGEHALGLLAAMAAVATAGTYVTSALGQSASPRLASYWRQEQLAHSACCCGS